jgi:CTP:molybdopterin cytidylyltransferase MocA
VRPIGILLAAGRGRRMGGGKMLRRLPAPDGRPLVLASFEVLARACDVVVAVLGGEDAGGVRAVLSRAAADAAPAMRLEPVTGRPDAPMLASIRAGLARAAALDERASALVHPGDVPHAAPATVDAILMAAAEDAAAGGRARACMPATGPGGRGGHPVLLPPPVARRVRALDEDHPGGLRALWEAEPALARRVPVDDPGCRRDVDTPADLAAAGSGAGAGTRDAGGGGAATEGGRRTGAGERGGRALDGDWGSGAAGRGDAACIR